MDHTFNMYIGLCYLQLDNFKKAEEFIKKSINYRIKKWGQAHHLEHFYLGIVYYEQNRLELAKEQFDLALTYYHNFPDVKYYMARILHLQGKKEEAKQYYTEALDDIKKGYTINEDNAIYEEYPYQIKKYWLEK